MGGDPLVIIQWTWVVLIISVLQRNFRGSLVDFREHGKATLKSQAARKPGLVA